MSTTVDSREIRSPIIASWVLMIATCVLAVIPVLGFSAWIIGAVTVPIVLVLAIVAIAKGGTWSGIFVLLMAMIVVPVVIAFAPIISTVIMAAILDEKAGAGIESVEAGADTAIEAGSESEAAAAEESAESVTPKGLESEMAEEPAAGETEAETESNDAAPGESPPQTNPESGDQSPSGSR